MARFCPLFSGSSGNCTYIAAGDEGLLIDAGVSARRIERALVDRDIDPASIRTIAVTHEHSDHIAGLRVLCKKYGYRLVASAGTLYGLEKAGQLAPGTLCTVIPEAGLAVGDMWLRAFPTPHDTPESTGYVIELPDGRRAAVATDMGTLTPRVMDEIARCDLILMESNHDVGLLKNGPYPYPLKQRILGDRGHLSNASCSEALPKLVQSGAVYLILAHLSAQNNRPDLAYAAAARSLAAAGVRLGVDCRLSVAPRDATAPIQWI